MGESKPIKAARKRRAAEGFKPGYTIGISIFVNADGSLGLFENGFRQNVLFLYLLFKASPNCARVYLLNHGESDDPRFRTISASSRGRSSVPTRSSTSSTMSSAPGRPSTGRRRWPCAAAAAG